MRNQSYRPSQRTDFCRAYLPRFPLNQVRPVSVSETRSCDQGIVDLWYYFYEDADAELLASHRALLTPDELERHSSLRFERDRLLFLATRALVRTVLSNYAAVSAADWRFTADDRGKPRIVAPVVMPAIHFNLTNTLGLVVCAVSVAHELVGVDAERTDREVEAVALADRFFSPSEASRLEGLAAAERSELFFSYWTLKES
jgi:4'-phosphopantetheinyl transferase